MAGSLVHFELPSEDALRAKQFWSGVFGWSFNDPGIAGLVLDPDGREPGRGDLRADGPRGMIVYFDTDDIDASVARVRELGGQPRKPIPRRLVRPVHSRGESSA